MKLSKATAAAACIKTIYKELLEEKTFRQDLGTFLG